MLDGSAFRKQKRMVSATAIRYIKRRRILNLLETNSERERTREKRSAIMKLFTIFAVFVVLACTSVSTLPAVYDGPLYELTPIEDPVVDVVPSDLSPIRNRRVTCDLLSWQSKWLTINHSACAANCLRQRRRGGRCRNGICVCRN